jgi:hypothetical protein
MTDPSKDSPEALHETIDRYNTAWNEHDLDAIMAMHAPDMVFENHTAGESAVGKEARAHIGSIFATWPDIAFTPDGSTSTRDWWSRNGLRRQPTPTRCAVATSSPSQPGSGSSGTGST